MSIPTTDTAWTFLGERMTDDWTEPVRNEWLAVNRYSIQGPNHTRRPDRDATDG